MKIAQLVVVAIAVMCAALGGYFAGREEMKREIRTALVSAITPAPSTARAQHSAAVEKPTVAPTIPKFSAPDPVAATLVSKDFQPANPESGEFRAKILMSMIFDNKGTKDIRAFDGVLVFTDLLDNIILQSTFAINHTIKSKEKYQWDASVDYNEFRSHDVQFRNEEFANIKTKLILKKILFVDGSVENF